MINILGRPSTRIRKTKVDSSYNQKFYTAVQNLQLATEENEVHPTIALLKVNK